MKWLLVVACLFFGCRRQHYWLLDAPLQDMVDHTWLKAAGVNVVEAPETYIDPKLGKILSRFVDDTRKYYFYYLEQGYPEEDLLRIPAEYLQRPMIIKFVDESKGDPESNLVVKTKINPEGGVMGVCKRYKSFTRTVGGKHKAIQWFSIEILESMFKRYANSSKCQETYILQMIVYHELYHCLFDKGHYKNGGGEGSGLMRTKFKEGDDSACGENWEEIKKQAFNPDYARKVEDIKKERSIERKGDEPFDEGSQEEKSGV